MKRLFPVICVFSCWIAGHSFAGSATWSSNPVSTDWSVGRNWMPMTAPDCRMCVASFGTSTLPQVELFADGSPLLTSVAQVTFSPGASAYTITSHGFADLLLWGAGVVNDSGVQQNFVALGSGGQGHFTFHGSSSAGSNLNTFTTSGAIGIGFPGGDCSFSDESTAGTAIIVNEGGSLLGASGGETNFIFSSTAGNATIINGGATDQGSTGGQVQFESESTAGESVILNNGAENNGGSGGQITFQFGGNGGSAQITNNGGTVSGAGGGTISFSYYSNAESATIINNGGTVAGAGGAVLSFINGGDADQSVLVANGGTNGGAGGQIFMSRAARGSSPQFKIYGNGLLDASYPVSPGVDAGSLEGDGLVFLGANSLAIGFNDLNSTFAGTIMDGGSVQGVGGSVTKLGAGTLTLSGSNTYTGGTILSAGGLTISNTTGSGTGTGSVTVEAGTLGGKGIIAGPATIGTGSATGSFLQPGKGASNPTTLTIQDILTLKSDSSYVWKLNTNKVKADKIVANGVSIESGAQFSLTTVANKELTVGKIFTAISNTSASPIGGTFANLADGSTVTAGVNKLQASYVGGDGNDLTLTVVP